MGGLAANPALGAVLRSVREAAGLTRAEAARELDTCAARSVASWEYGDRIPKLETLARLADLYGLDVRQRVRLLEAAGFRFTPEGGE